ncbi:hypothetical protein ACRB8A_13305 [Arthrobacter sp. G.S.26]|uniref:hypothetical protein n=1 Tax=Arthrobacter sp. G.S.26 TaxID=3433706 RepID=UPI003D781B4E
MFDLFKDLDTYKGIPPYASEHYGVYQPLLGWESRLTKKWIQRGGIIVDPHIKKILDARFKPGPELVQNDHPLEFLAFPLQPGSGISPYSVILTKTLNSELLVVLRDAVQGFVEQHEGRLPQGAEWNALIEINNFMDPEAGPLRRVNDIHRSRLNQQMMAQAQGGQIAGEVLAATKQAHLALMQYESQIAVFLLAQAEAQQGADPNELAKLFSVTTAAPATDILRPTDPLASIDPRASGGTLSPVGFVHLFRQYFFDLGTFLGESVEHVWLAPGTTIELIEVSTRKSVVEHQEESASESTTTSEESSAVKDELSDAVKAENSSSTKLGVSTTNTVNFGVYQGTASANYGVESSRKEAREATHKQNREQSEKLSSQIKRSFKSIFKTVTESTDVRSRRYLLQNTSNKLVNYELRRKMRRVGVQLQDMGNQLCWQVFIDDAGVSLGLSELVHFAESPDLANLKDPEFGPPPANIAKKITVPIPFTPILNYSNWHANYEFAYLERGNTPYKDKFLGTVKGDDDDDDSQVIMGPFTFKIDPPQSDYVLTDDIRIIGPQGNKQAVVRTKTKNADGSFTLVLQFINFNKENVLNLDVELVFAPQAAALTEYEANKKKIQEKYDVERQRLLKKSFLESVRQRIKDASSIRSRPSWDLREEERTVIYRELLQRLMLDSWDIASKNQKDTDNLRLSHVRSEVIRAIFDVDGMLYFVAPEWWMPRRHRSQLNLQVQVGDPSIELTDNDVVKWDDVEKRPDNYRITEDSAPARFGSSLGWLLQLDGDNLRNAFLNAPWVKAVIPIRPGREGAALNWLRSIEGHENDGWNTPYIGTAEEDAEFSGKTVGEVLEIIAGRMEKENGKIVNVLEADKVFEKGFDPLASGFDAGLPANKVFSQWISILPTDQIVASEYEPKDLTL